MKHSIGWRNDSRLPAQPRDRDRQIANDVADSANLAGRKCAVFSRDIDDLLVTNFDVLVLTREVQLLTERTRGNQRQAAIRYAKSACAISFCILSDNCIGRNDASFVDDCAVNPASLTDLDLGQYYGLENFAVRVHLAVGEQQGLFH